jgi:hypothetical protein
MGTLAVGELWILWEYVCYTLCSPQGDPFLSSCLRAVRGHSLMMLEHRARILIPPRHAATLMGTPDDSQLVEDDDSGLLEEDEVFLQVRCQQAGIFVSKTDKPA